MHDQTLKIVTNLDRGAIEARLADVGHAAREAGLSELASLFNETEGMPRAQIEQRVGNAVRWLADKPQYQSIRSMLELIEINIPNLK
jgi:hypothetical protein